jgi:hypothetical protein
LTELERFEVWLEEPKPVVDFGTEQRLDARRQGRQGAVFHVQALDEAQRRRAGGEGPLQAREHAVQVLVRHGDDHQIRALGDAQVRRRDEVRRQGARADVRRVPVRRVDLVGLGLAPHPPIDGGAELVRLRRGALGGDARDDAAEGPAAQDDDAPRGHGIWLGLHSHAWRRSSESRERLLSFCAL